VNFLVGILNVLIVLGSLFLICVILIQRGKGGGLAGAFGGVGGSSAFGTKAGDVFTKITIGVAIGWMLTAMLLVILSNRNVNSASADWGNESTSASKDLGTSSKSKGKSPAAGRGAGAGDKGAGAPSESSPVNLPAISDEPPGSPAPAPPSPAKPATPPK
jgi:preprotein translocase subunit SecG